MSNIDGMPSIKDQRAEALRWAGLLWQANYPTELHIIDEPEPFNQGMASVRPRLERPAGRHDRHRRMRCELARSR